MSQSTTDSRTDFRSARPNSCSDSAALHGESTIDMWPATSSAIFVPRSLRSADSPNSAAILICWAGFAGFANCIRRLATIPASSVCSAFAGCSTIWPPKAIPSSPVSSSAKISRSVPEYLPRPLSPEDDRRLQEELRRTDNLYSNALLLTRVTGIRIGECIHLPLDCLRHIGPEQWALHVPLGKLHTERLVPLDAEGLRLLDRILELRAQLLPAVWRNPKASCCLALVGRFALFQMLRLALADFAKRAGCADTSPISPHRLRHTWASDMLRCGISLPALKELMGHKDIRMTLRYLKVTQPDLQREFYRARHNTPQPYCIPSLSVLHRHLRSPRNPPRTRGHTPSSGNVPTPALR